MQTIDQSREIVLEQIYKMKEPRIRIDKYRVLKAIDSHKDSPVYEEIQELFEEIKEQAVALIKPQLVLKIEKNDPIIMIPELTECEQIIYTTVTLGAPISDAITKKFEQGEYIEGMLLDAIGTGILFDLNEQLHSLIYNYIKSQGMGAVILSPGERRIPIKYQKIIKDKLGSESGVSVTESFLLEPIKSTSKIYGVAKGLDILPKDHSCKDCNDPDCKWRLMPYEG